MLTNNTTESMGFNKTVISIYNTEFLEKNLVTLIFMFLMMTIGTFGNALVMIVYYFKTGKSTANCYIQTLAAMDFFSCILVHPYMIDTTINMYDQTSEICKIFQFLIYISICTQIFLLLAISIDRYHAVCYPMMLAKIRKKRMAISIVASTIGGSLICLPVLEIYGIRDTEIIIGGVKYNGHTCDIQNKYGNSILVSVYNLCMMVTFFITVITMIFLYGKIARTAYLSTCRIGNSMGIKNDKTLPVRSLEIQVQKQDEEQRSCDGNTDSNQKLNFTDAIDQELSVHLGHGKMLATQKEAEVSSKQQSPTLNETMLQDPLEKSDDSTDVSLTLAMQKPSSMLNKTQNPSAMKSETQQNSSATLHKIKNPSATLIETENHLVTPNEIENSSATLDETENPSPTLNDTENPSVTLDETENHSAALDKSENLSATVVETENLSATVVETENPSATLDTTKNPSATLDKTENSSAILDKTQNYSVKINETQNPSTTLNDIQNLSHDSEIQIPEEKNIDEYFDNRFRSTRNLSSTKDHRSNSKSMRYHVSNDNEHNQAMQSHRNNGLKATKVLFSVTAIFLLSWTPYWVVTIGELTNEQFWPQKTDFDVALYTLLCRLIHISNAINPILYSIGHRHFVLDCKACFRKIKNHFCSC